MNGKSIALIGNPNCGKSTLFNLVTGSRQTVGNWPGVTVERKSGSAHVAGREVTVVDLPGVYSLGGGGGLDEGIARDFVLGGDADLLVNIVDASNLERQLALTSELVEFGMPMVIVLNMMDEAERYGRVIDAAGMAAVVGCPVLPFVATRSRGREELLAAIGDALLDPSRPVAPRYPIAVERGVEELSGLLATQEGPAARRVSALRLIEGLERVCDGARSPVAVAEVEEATRERADAVRRRVEDEVGEAAADVVADARFRFAQELAQRAIVRPGGGKRSLSDRIDRVVLNRYLGVPVFLLVMYLLFVVSFSGGNIFLDFIDGMSHALFVSFPGWALEHLHAPGWTVQLVATAVGGAIQLVLPFMAPVGFTFLFLTILEESGYMARGTFAMERFMRRFGLPGKTLVPMVIGFGCNVPAVMATRGIENERDRLVVTMMQPFMSCSARLVIYMAFAAVFFRHYGGQVVFGLYVLGIVMAVLTALILGKTVLRGEPQPFLLDLPPYRFPTLKALAISVWQRLKIYIWRVGRVIATATVVIYLLSSFAITPSGLRTTPNPGDSLLGVAGRAITPVFNPMGISDDNWPATVGLLTGAVAKEVVIGTLNGAYSRERSQVLPDYLDANVPEEMLAAAKTIPANARLLVASVADPLGFGNLSESGTAAKYSSASQTTLRALGSYFTPAAAVAYLIFVLLYIPCVSTMGAIRRETGSWRWTLYAIGWGILVAYGLGTLWYQLATAAAHPAESLLWTLGVATAFFGVVKAMHWAGTHRFDRWRRSP